LSESRQYELVYILPADATEQQVTELNAQVEGIIGRLSGTLNTVETWGRRKLAYEIGRHKEGTYVLTTLTGSGELVKEIDRRLRVNDQVIRHLVVRVDEELRVAERTRSRRKATSERRRTARGLPPQIVPRPEHQQDDDRNDDMEG
jgi:small subunit ribosomal protein S6